MNILSVMLNIAVLLYFAMITWYMFIHPFKEKEWMNNK